MAALFYEFLLSSYSLSLQCHLVGTVCGSGGPYPALCTWQSPGRDPRSRLLDTRGSCPQVRLWGQKPLDRPSLGLSS